MIRTPLILALAIALAATLAAPALGASVRLRGAALVDAGSPVTLGDIALLEGAAAEALAGVEVAEGDARAGAPVTVTLADVRRAVREAGASMGRLAISGTSCVVRRRAPAAETGARRARDRAERPRHEALDLAGPATVRTRLAQMLPDHYMTDAGRIRVRFDRADQDLLETPVWERRVALTPRTSEASRRLLVDVRLFDGERIVLERTIGADVEVRREALALRHGVERGEEIGAADLEPVDRWMAPDGGAPVPESSRAVGMLARKDLRAGETLRESDLVAPLAVRRGEAVTVVCLNGEVGLQARGRVLDDGRVGELVACRLDGSEREFLARVDGAGRVVVALDAGG